MIVRNLLAVAATVCIFAVSAFAQNPYYNQPNAFGGTNYYSHSGSYMGYTQPNAFGGMNYYNRSGFTGSSQPNVFGGMNYSSPSGFSGSSQPNAFGGSNYNHNGH